MDKKEEELEKYKLGKLEWSIISFSILCLIFSFVSPYALTQKGWTEIDFRDTGNIGDTIGGIMNPFVALVGVLVTFLAFLIQYRANQIQVKNFSKEIKNQNFQFKKSQFETQFYEMLKLHKENVKTISVKNELNNEFIYGQKALNDIFKEFLLCYRIVKKFSPNTDKRKLVNKAYTILWNGWYDLDGKKDDENLKNHLLEIKNEHIKNNYDIVKTLKEKIGINTNIELDIYHVLFNGNGYQLANYYRHLFHTVKHVTKQSEDFVSYEEQRNYLRILRAQLTNNEQALIFYNWFSEFGRKWEELDKEDGNKFLTKYRLIHNLYQNLIISDINLRDCFPTQEKIRSEKDRTDDYLFEYEG